MNAEIQPVGQINNIRIGDCVVPLTTSEKERLKPINRRIRITNYLNPSYNGYEGLCLRRSLALEHCFDCHIDVNGVAEKLLLGRGEFEFAD